MEFSLKPDLIVKDFIKFWKQFRCCYGLDEAVNKYRYSEGYTLETKRYLS